MKVFQIGFNRCGTKAIAQLLGLYRQPIVHSSGGSLARRIYSNLLRRRPPIAGLEQTVLFSDMEALNDYIYFEAYKLFPALHHHYPDAMFLLNTRPVHNWIRSRLELRAGLYAERHMRVLGLSSQEALVKHWKQDWHAHHERVRAYFTAKGRFVEFDVENDHATKLTNAMPEFALDPALHQAELSHRWKPT
jgi:hypothetical protein